MKAIKFLSSVYLLCFSLIASADGFVWRDQQGNPIADSDTMKSKDGFAASVILTSDRDWEEKWNTPKEHAPEFTITTTAEVDQIVTFLVFFANPKAGPDGQMDISCDVIMTMADGLGVMRHEDVPCAGGPVPEDSNTILLTNAIISFYAEKKDPIGEWIFDVVVRDKHAGIEIPLRYTFNVVKAEGQL